MEKSIPAHVAIIMDGNGRWAKKQSLIRSKGHSAGVEAVRNIVKASKNLGVKALTLYTFSTENWARPKMEVTFLMKLLLNFFKNEVDELHENGVKISIIGDVSKFTKEIQDEMDLAVEKTKDNKDLILSLALNYGGQDEILSACNKLLRAYKNEENHIITKEEFEHELYTSELPPLDLLIRPGGEKRISNFLLWQCAYAEFVFTDTLWPDFTVSDYENAIDEFSTRKRRFGKV